MRHVDIILGITIASFAGIMGLYFVSSGQIPSQDVLIPVKKSEEPVTTQQPTSQNQQQSYPYQEQASQYFQQAAQYLQQITQWQQKTDQSQQQATQYKNQADQYQQQASQATQQASQYQQQATQSQQQALQYQDQASQWQQQYQNSLQTESCKPTTTIVNETYNWKFCDSKNNPYAWSMPIQSYDNNIKRSFPQKYLYLKMPNGSIIKELDYTQFVEPDFRKVIDSVYDNAGSDDHFIFEVWYIVSQMTTYSKDMTNNNLWPIEVFSRAGGDCKDLSILIASMIESSPHTKNWKIQLEYLDYDNPTDPKTINHMIVRVDTGTHAYYIEATAKTVDELNWLNGANGVNLTGWAIDVIH